jgi:hypothetical protein
VELVERDVVRPSSLFSNLLALFFFKLAREIKLLDMDIINLSFRMLFLGSSAFVVALVKMVLARSRNGVNVEHDCTFGLVFEVLEFL